MDKKIFVENDFPEFETIIGVLIRYENEENCLEQIFVFIMNNNLFFILENLFQNSNCFHLIKFDFLNKFEFEEKNFQIWKFLADNKYIFQNLNLNIFQVDYLLKISKNEENFLKIEKLLKIMDTAQIYYTFGENLILIKEIQNFQLIKKIINRKYYKKNQNHLNSLNKLLSSKNIHQNFEKLSNRIERSNIIEFAAQNKNVEILKFFLKKEKEIIPKYLFINGNRFYKPIFLAAKLNLRENIICLQNLGADLYFKDLYNKKPVYDLLNEENKRFFDERLLNSKVVNDSSS